MERTRSDRWLPVFALALPLVAAAALIPARDAIANANVALVLVVAVVAVASRGRRYAAALAALSAALGFTIFHTEPYQSLRINTRDDVETMVLLLVVGLAVGEIALRGRRARAAASRERQDLDSIRGLSALVADGEDPSFVVLAVTAELTQLLGLIDCRFETEPRDDQILPVVHRDGSVRWGPTPWDTGRFGLPHEGAVIPVLSHGRRKGRFVLHAPAALQISGDQLAKAYALVDQAGASLAARGAA